jgi:hypothetical protein
METWCSENCTINNTYAVFKETNRRNQTGTETENYGM